MWLAISAAISHENQKSINNGKVGMSVVADHFVFFSSAVIRFRSTYNRMLVYRTIEMNAVALIHSRIRPSGR